MSGTRPDPAELVGELSRTVEELQTELEPDRPPLRPPTPGELLRFTSEVTIPAIILALETNIRVLGLLQRTLRLAGGREPTGGSTSGARERAESIGRASLARLDDALAEVQAALEGRPEDDRARELLAQARSLREEVDASLGADGDGQHRAGESVDVDVEAELQSIKDDVDDGDEE